MISKTDSNPVMYMYKNHFLCSFENTSNTINISYYI